MYILGNNSDRNLILPIWHFLYSRRNLNNFESKYVFPKNNLLSTLHSSQTSARTLVLYIFLDKKEDRISRKRKVCNSSSCCFQAKRPRTINSECNLQNHSKSVAFEVCAPSTLVHYDVETDPAVLLSDPNSTHTKSTKTSEFLKAFGSILTQPTPIAKEQGPTDFIQAFGSIVPPKPVAKDRQVQSDYVKAFGSVSSKVVPTAEEKLSINLANTTETALGQQRPTAKERQQSSRGIHIPKRYRRAIHVCQAILQQLKRHSMVYLLKTHCKIEQNHKNVELTTVAVDEIKEDLVCSLRLYSSVNEVFLFLRSVIKLCFRQDLVWGSRNNESAFFKNLKTFLYCRRFDKISVTDFCLGISFDSITWLKGPHAKESFSKFLKWMLLDFVFEIIRRFFYVTEHAKTGHKLYYYRKDVWARVVSCASELMVAKKIWMPSAMHTAPAQYKVRFCPKQNGVRVIMKKIKNKNAELIDLDACFDSIPVEFLLQILRNILSRASKVSVDHVIKPKKYAKVSACSDIIYNTIKSSLRNVHLDVLGKAYIKTQGIPQGWNLSSMLCNIFYGDLETKYLREFMKSKENIVSLLMRFTDDYLFVSTEKEEALKFVKVMENGFVEYGAKINWTKTCCNFSINDESSSSAHQIRVVSGEETFSWFGLLFPTSGPIYHTPKLSRQDSRGNSDCGVSLDLFRYAGPQDIRNSITVNPSGYNYLAVQSVSRSLRLRVRSVCFDIKVNSCSRIMRSIYELAVLTACQWLIHNQAKPKGSRAICPGVIKLMVSRFATVMLATMRKKLPDQKFPNRALTSWVFFKAFYNKLSRYPVADYGKIRERLFDGMREQAAKLSKDRNWQYNKSYLRSATATFPKELISVQLR